MRSTAKLLSVLALGSALGGCSMAGTGDFFADQYAPTQASQMPQYWGGTQSPCQPAQVQAPTACETAHQPAAHYSQAAPQYQADQGQAYQSQGYTGQSYSGQDYTGQVYQDQAYGGYQGQPAYQQGGYAPAGYAPAYVGARGGSSNGLRKSYTYGNLGATLYDVDSDLYGLQARAGWQSKGLFGAEVEGSFGVSDDDATIIAGGTPLQADLGIDTQLAAFGVLRHPVSNKFNVLGRVGYHRTEFDGEVTDGVDTADINFDTDGIAYGAGVEYAFNPLMGVRADYTRYDLDGETADAISLAVTRKF